MSGGPQQTFKVPDLCSTREAALQLAERIEEFWRVRGKHVKCYLEGTYKNVWCVRSTMRDGVPT